MCLDFEYVEHEQMDIRGRLYPSLHPCQNFNTNFGQTVLEKSSSWPVLWQGQSPAKKRITDLSATPLLLLYLMTEDIWAMPEKQAQVIKKRKKKKPKPPNNWKEKLWWETKERGKKYTWRLILRFKISYQLNSCYASDTFVVKLKYKSDCTGSLSNCVK